MTARRAAMASNDELKVALCCIGKTNAESVDEWAKHHFNLGVDRIFIYDDGTSSRILENVDEERLPLINLIEFGYCSEYKTKAYANFYRLNKQAEKGKATNLPAWWLCENGVPIHYDWIAFVDVGEYIIVQPIEGDDGSIPPIKRVLSRDGFQNFEVVRLNKVLFSDQAALQADLNIEFPSNNEENAVKIAKSIVNCKTFGFYFTEHTIQRNGTPITQCLPNLKALPPSDAIVDGMDIGTMYLTSNQLEALWVDWRAKKDAASLAQT